MPETDEELLAAARSGDREALGRFWSRHEASAWRAALAFSGGHEAAQEALQETGLVLSRGLSGFDPALGTPAAWLMGIVRRQAARSVRMRAGGRRTLSLDLPLEGGGSLADLLDAQTPRPEDRSRRREDLETALSALAALPEDLREAVTSRWILGLSYEDMAVILGIRPEAARQRACRGLQALRESLDREDGRIG